MMKIEPKMRGFICTTAHPEGCAMHVQEQIDYVLKQPKVDGAKKVLVVGASQGFGLASRITSTFAADADTIGLFFERPSMENRTGTSGWYNSAAFTIAARKAGRIAENINGDAFSDEIKQQTIELIKEKLGGEIDLLIYSIASPKRTDPVSGETYSSVIKPLRGAYTNKTVDFHTDEVKEVTIEQATADEAEQTVKVMGGDDWQRWIDQLQAAGVLAKGFTTVAYSYIGPEVTQPIYREGTIGKAKNHIEATAHQLSAQLAAIDGRALISVNKALVTQASSAIPVVPLYNSLLYKAMKARGTHEGCIEQMCRLWDEQLYAAQGPTLDDGGRIRIDDREMAAEVQAEVAKNWEKASSATLAEVADMEGYRDDFYQLFGFRFAGIDYDAEVDPNVLMP